LFPVVFVSVHASAAVSLLFPAELSSSRLARFSSVSDFDRNVIFYRTE
jgi:hypothetical protein